ncbi:MAG TPA: YqaA family protein [Burkholderiaceae bacterium]|nr:YqaA family protein [Burkholderiaceae bacterium]
MIDSLLAWFAVPQQGLLALGIVAFLSATLLPGMSEVFLIGVIAADASQAWTAIGVATLGNVLGSLTTYGLGRLGGKLPHPDAVQRWQPKLQRYGPPILFFSWAPLIGDVLSLLAGWLKLPVVSSMLWVSVGKALRYFVVVQATLAMI